MEKPRTASTKDEVSDDAIRVATCKRPHQSISRDAFVVEMLAWFFFTNCTWSFIL